MPAAEAGRRQDTYEVRVNFEGNYIGVWDKRTGGELDSDQTTYYPGGMNPPISLGGRRTTGNVVVSRLYTAAYFSPALKRQLLNGVGKGQLTVTQQGMDVDGNRIDGDKVQWVGILKRATFPEADSEATGAALVELELQPEGYPTVV